MNINERLPAAMDRFVQRTGLFRMTMIARPEPRSMRWLPLILLVAFPIGYALMVEAMAGDDLRRNIALGIAGVFLFFGAYGMSFYVRFAGPRLMPDMGHALDERERMIRDRAGNISGIVLSFVAIAGCFYLGFAHFWNLWRPDTIGEWAYLGLGLQGAYFTLPTLIASWLQPRDCTAD